MDECECVWMDVEWKDMDGCKWVWMDDQTRQEKSSDCLPSFMSKSIGGSIFYTLAIATSSCPG